jgi:lysophospholipase L1-like esterase
MTKLKPLLLILLLLLTPCWAWGASPIVTAYGTFGYTVASNVASITSWAPTAAETEVRIPDAATLTADYGSSVTSVKVAAGSTAFAGKTTFTRAVFPAEFSTVGASTFKNCYNLSSISFAYATVASSINANAFENCTGLTSLTIVGGVNFPGIGNSAFKGCTGLTTLVIDTPAIGSSYTGQFENCTHLSSVTLNSSIPKIPNSCFAGCTLLTSITLPTSLTEIGSYAFSASGLTSITIPVSVTTIDAGALNASNLATVTLAGSGALTARIATSTITSLIVGAGVTALPDNGFSACTSLLDATFLGNAPTLGTETFSASTLEGEEALTGPAPNFMKHYYQGATGFTQNWDDNDTYGIGGIVGFGDSITGHVRTDTPASWWTAFASYKLGALMGITGDNYGIGGITSTHLADNVTLMLRTRPRFVLLNGGYNDSGPAAGTKAASVVAANYVTMLNAIVAAGATPIIMAITPCTLVTACTDERMALIDTYRAAILALLPSYPTAIYFDPRSTMSEFREGGDDCNNWDYLSGAGYGSGADGIHPTEAGKTEIARLAGQALKARLGGNSSPWQGWNMRW